MELFALPLPLSAATCSLSPSRVYFAGIYETGWTCWSAYTRIDDVDKEEPLKAEGSGPTYGGYFDFDFVRLYDSEATQRVTGFAADSIRP